MTIFRTLFIGLMFTGALLVVSGQADARQMENMNIVVVRTIDKISARTHTFEIPVDKTVKFGASLFIKVRSCRKSSPIDKPEAASFLQIWERKPTDDKPKWVFSGWMFASNPSLSAMDHPVYDVWVIDCKNDTTSVKSQEFSTEATPKGDPVKAKAEEEEESDETPAADTGKADKKEDSADDAGDSEEEEEIVEDPAD